MRFPVERERKYYPPWSFDGHRAMAPEVLVVVLFVMVGTSCAWTYVPNSRAKSLNNDVGAPVIMVFGLRVWLIPFSAGNNLINLTMYNTK